jgi:predicted MPP superfamily phosphohydrolase
MVLYTNRGLGVVGLPVRFFCRPEISVITLRSPRV